MARFYFLVTVVALVVFPAAVRAHALGAEAKLKDGRVTIEAFYDDDTPAEDSKVVVSAADGKVVAEGKTDQKGTWTFAAPPPGQYKVAVDGGAGHRTTIALTISDRGVRTSAEERATSDDSVTVSEGPTRSESTGPMRLVWPVVAVVVILGATWVLTRVTKARKRGRAPGADARPQAQ